MSPAVPSSDEAERPVSAGAGRLLAERIAAIASSRDQAAEAGLASTHASQPALSEARLVLCFGVLFALLLGMAVYCVVQGRRFFSFDHWVAHTQTVITDIERTSFKVQTAESSLRGYVVTGNEAFLPPYRAVLPAIATCAQKIRADTGDNPLQQRNCRRLEAAIQAKIATMEERYQQRRTLGAAALDAKYVTSRGQETMAKFLAIAQEMIGIENRLLQRRAEERAALLRSTLMTLFVTSIAAAGLIVGGFLLLRTQWRRSQALGGALTRANAGLQREVADRRQAEDGLLAEREFLATLLDNLQAGVVSCDAQGRLTHCNRAAIALHGLPTSGPLPPISLWPEYFDLLEADDLKPVNGDDNPLRRALLGEVLRDREFHVQAKNGAQRTLSLNATPLTDENGQRVGAVAVMHDVTAQRRAREGALDSLREKETLLQEVHHRVKNNLQIIGSLLTMQSRRTRSPAALEALSESVGRVRSIALVHEKLYGSATFQCVEAADYLRALARNLYSALGSARLKKRESRVALEFDLESGYQLDAAHAIACGLIVNEALTNSFKHAFPDNRTGRVTVALTRLADESEFDAAPPLLVDRAGAGPPLTGFSPDETEDRTSAPRCGLQLEVRDDGVGVAPLFFTPEGIAGLTRKSLGLRLIRDLSKQVGGRLEFTPSDRATGLGLTLRLNFSVQAAALAC